MMDIEPEFVNVAIRIKPVSNKETNSTCLQIISTQPPVLLLPDRAQIFHFDAIFTDDVDQETVFKETVESLVKNVKMGYNCTVFAYGQTGTGKTYTIGTDPNVRCEKNFGLIPRALNQFFDCTKDPDFEVEISVSFIEIYNEKVYDLLQNENKPLVIKGLKPQGFSQNLVTNSYEAREFLEMGNKNRHIAGTKQNAESSRSHAIFTIYCTVRHKDYETTAKLNLVDLAGCESVKKTGNKGSTFHEGVNINKGLLCISQVITALSNNSCHIPYRQSIITSILQDSLNKQNFVSLIACVSPLPENYTETCQTLDFAFRVKKVKSKPEVNEVISRYRRNNPTLFQSTRTGSTPFKKSATPHQIPHYGKRSKFVPLVTAITEKRRSFDSESLTSVSSLSNTIVSSISQNDLTQALSPVIRRYMTTMESSLMDKLELVIKSTLKRSNKLSRLAKEVDKENIDGTPCGSWNKIQDEVSKIVKSQIALQLTSKSTRATSSPIEQNQNKIRKVLSYGSVADEVTEVDDSMLKSNNSHIYSLDENVQFKVPEIPIQNTNAKSKCAAISPIEPIMPRRSIRLSMKNQNSNDSLQQCDISVECSYLKTRGNSKKTECLKNDALSLEDKNEKYNSVKSRHSVRLTKERNVTNTSINVKISKNRKNLKSAVAHTPAGKRLMKKQKKDSPCTAHTKKVLDILKNGNLQELQTLHSVGVKSAQQVILFRQIKGQMKKISDLSEMPGWHGKKFDKFVGQNFLKSKLV